MIFQKDWTQRIKAGTITVVFILTVFMTTHPSLTSAESPDSAFPIAISVTYQATTQANVTTNGLETTKTYWFAEGYSLVDTPERKTLVDFQRNTLTSIDKTTGNCARFELSKEPSAEESQASKHDRDGMFRKRLHDLMGSYRIYNSDRYEQIAGYQSRKTTVQFAANLRMFRMVVAPVLEHFDHRFTETAQEYWVTDSIVQIEHLVGMAHKRMAVYRANPLLVQIDFLGLLPELKGFPVRMTRIGPSGVSETTETLVEIQEYRTMPDVFSLLRDCPGSQFQNDL